MIKHIQFYPTTFQVFSPRCHLYIMLIVGVSLFTSHCVLEIILDLNKPLKTSQQQRQSEGSTMAI